MPAHLCGRVLGGFVIGEKIGDGGYGEVFRARQTNPEREVVVKVLFHRVRDPLRFRREVQSLARVAHPCAVKVLASGIEDDGVMWLAMELVRGQTLRRWLAEHGPISLARLVPLVEQIAEAVHAAHELGIVHRDLKPENIMITEHAGRLTPTLLDFGIAKWLDDMEIEITSTDIEEMPEDFDDQPATIRSRAFSTETRRRTDSSGYEIGTWAYMAPEMWSDPRNAGAAADVYALGVIAYEALAGTQPFRARGRDEYEEAHARFPVPPLDGSTPRLFEVLDRALAKQAEGRPSALGFATELRAACQADPAEQIRASARLWEARGRTPDLLWGPKEVAAAARRQQIAENDVVTAAFLTASRRHAQARRWKALAGALAVVLAGGAYRSYKNAEIGEERVAAATLQAAVEQGRQALLLGNTAQATEHFEEAYRLGDRSWPTEFMRARAMEPQQAELARFQSLKGRMWSAAYSPDERQIVTTDEGGAQIWDARSYRRLHVLPHADVVHNAVYTSDGARVITSCGDGAVRIWDAKSGTRVHELRADGPSKRWVAVDVSGDLVAAISLDGRSVYVWNAMTGAVVASSHGDKEGALPTLAFSPDGRWLAAIVGEEGRLFDTATWKQTVSIPGPVRALAWDPTGTRLGTGSPSGDISIWEVPSLKQTRIRETGSSIDIVALSPDGKLVGTAERDGTARVWDAETGAQRSVSTRTGRIRSLVFDATSTQVALAASDGSVRVVEALTGLPLAMLDGAQDAIWSMHFDSSASHLLAASWDGSARVWSARSLHRQWASAPIAEQCGLYRAAVPDQRFVIVGCENHATQVWDTAHHRLLAELPPMQLTMDGDFAPVLPVVSDDGSRAALARGNRVELYELPGGRLAQAIDHGAQVTAVAFGRSGDVVSGDVDGGLWRTPDGQRSIALPAASAGIDAVALLADGRVVSVDAAKKLRVISSSGVNTLDTPTRITLLRPSQDGSKLVTIQDNQIPSLAGRGDAAVLWDLRGPHLVATLSGQKGRVFTARWSEDRILTTASDGTVRLWNGTTGRALAVYKAQVRRFLTDAVMSSDGAILAAGGAGGIVEFWDAATGRELWALRAHASHVVGLHFDGPDLFTRGFGGELTRWRFAPASEVVRRKVLR